MMAPTGEFHYKLSGRSPAPSMHTIREEAGHDKIQKLLAYSLCPTHKSGKFGWKVKREGERERRRRKEINHVTRCAATLVLADQRLDAARLNHVTSHD